MTIREAIIHLTSKSFAEREEILIEHGTLTAFTFRFDSSVCGLRLNNE
jgi:hypothetical protein